MSVLTIEDWTPPSVNMLLKVHWSKAAGIKKEVKRRIWIAAIGSPCLMVATGKRRVGIAVTVAGRGGMPDPDNILKCLMDALTANRLIMDDSAAYVEIGKVTVERGQFKRTVISLEDI